MRKLISAMICLLLCMAVTAWSQTKEVSGKVSDANGAPVAGASVKVKGSKTGTTAASDGTFTLNVSPKAILQISAVGFETVEVSAAGSLNIILKAAKQELAEVVVTALGIRREKKALGYAVTTLDKKALELRPEGDIGRLLSGKAPGVNILGTSGLSGSGTNIQIRGANSITGGTAPLFVVDGVPFNSSTNAQTGAIYGHQTSSRFLDIDPNNIESVSILKGLSATVLYGEQGRNGVILITTKNGANKRTNKKSEITVTQSVFFNQVASLPEYQDSYGGGFSLTGGFSFFSNWGPRFTNPPALLPHPYSVGAVSGSFPELAGVNIEFKPQNNIEPFFRTGIVKNTSLNIATTLNGTTNLSASYSYMDDQGFIDNNRVFRNTFGIGLNSKLSNDFTFSSTLNFVKNDFLSPTTGYSGGSGATAGGSSVFADLFYTPRANDLFGWPYQTVDGLSAYYRPNNDIQNPRWALYNSLTGQKTNRTYGTASLKYEGIKGVNLIYRLGYDSYDELHELMLNKGGRSAASQAEYEKGIYRTVNGKNTIWDHTFMAQFQKSIGSNWRLDVNAGANARQDLYGQSGMKSTEQLVYGLFDHSNFVNHSQLAEDGLSDLDFKSEEKNAAVFAQAGFSFKEYLYLNVGGRNSWTSTLESANRSLFYPSGSISFIPTSAINGLKESKILNYLKVRLGYATSARFPSPYRTRPSLNINTNSFVDRGSNAINTNAISNRLANPGLKAELMGEFEAGIESKLIDNRLNVDFTYYRRKSTDQILDNPLDLSTGYSVQAINAGDLLNNGVELGMGYTVIRNRNWVWQLDGNFSFNRSEVQNLPEGILQVQTGGQFSSLGNYAINGKPLGIMQGTTWVKDAKTGARVVGSDGYYITSSQISQIGDPTPDYKLTGISTLSYKAFQFRMQWDYTKGGDIYSRLTNILMARGLSKATDVDRAVAVILPGVKQDGTPNDFQSAMDRVYFNTFLGASEQFMYDATVIRLRELSLSYYLPENVLNKTPFGSVSLTLSGQNLWFYAPNIPKYTNLDPEVSGGGVSNTRGFEYITGPTSRRMGVSLRVSF